MKNLNYTSPDFKKIELNVEESVANFGTDTSEKGWGEWNPL